MQQKQFFTIINNQQNWSVCNKKVKERSNVEIKDKIIGHLKGFGSLFRSLLGLLFALSLLVSGGAAGSVTTALRDDNSLLKGGGQTGVFMGFLQKEERCWIVSVTCS